MKNIYILLLAIGFSFSMKSYSQISYEEGYYIDNSNQKIECLIKNIDWKNNPTQFEYKPSEQDESKTVSIDSIKEFGIKNGLKYLRFVVEIDRSSNKIDVLSRSKNPIFKEEQLFLKVLLQGEASLLLYKDQSLTRYFYQTTTKAIEQLIFKEYKTPEDKIGTNNEFKRQLYDNLKCNALPIDNLDLIEYNKNSLLKFFIKYNSCNNSEFVNYETRVKSDLFNLNIRPGINSSSLFIDNSNISSSNTSYVNELTFRLGLELEFIMGFNRNKWAIIIEPTYQYYKAEDTAITNLSNTNVDYSSIELPVGLRHYLFLNNDSKVFINGVLIYDFILNNRVRNLEASSGVNFAIGVGYNYKNTYSVEFRYQTNRNILNDYLTWTSEYKTLSVIFGYTIF